MRLYCFLLKPEAPKEVSDSLHCVVSIRA